MPLPHTPGRMRGPDRRYVLARQLNLLQRAIAPWPRRAAPLLCINCGDGRFLNLFWQSGFDVQATEADPELRGRALRRKIPGLEVWAASGDSVPFEDDSFDWVVADLKNAEISGIRELARESVRLARRGAIFTFWNSSSLCAMCCGRPEGMWPGPALSWWRVWRVLRGLGAGRLSSMGTLCGPVFTWREHCGLSFLNTAISAAPLCAWCVARLDMAPLSTVTPLALRLGKTKGSPQPVMEYSRKFTDSD